MLVDALRRIDDGETVVDPTIVSRLLGRRRRDDPLAELTAREREVLALLAEGLSNRAIAERLFVTERTVEAHIKQIFLKLGLNEAPTDIAGCSPCSRSSAPDGRVGRRRFRALTVAGPGKRNSVATMRHSLSSWPR